MALVHYLYVGHFIPEEGFVRIKDHQIVAKRPINVGVVARLLRKYLGDTASPEALPEEWGMSILPEYLVCYVWSPRAALEFAADYAEQEGAIIVNMGSFLLTTPDQLRQWAAFGAASAAPVEAGGRSSA